ncbi:MAG: hypothetical protein HKN29_07020 [Rhodothermales bacterium]|nr:hypothetical protein [Rhodothermales bacterium]
MTKISRLVSILLLACLVTGCVSTKKRYERAMAHEQADEIVQAAEAYIEVLRSDRGYEDAAGRLHATGSRALAFLWDTAADLESTGAFELAITELDRMASIHDGAGDVGVQLDLPSDFADRRLFYLEAAVDTAMRTADDAAAAGNLEEALSVLSRIRTRYDVPESRQSALDHQLGSVLMNLARADMDLGRFKSGYDTALRALEILDPYDDEFEEGARALAAEALEQGIRGLALVPFVPSDVWRRAASDDLTSDVNDAIAFGEMGRQSEFIAILDPGQTRRVARAMGLGGNPLRRADFRELGEQVGADYVLGGELTGFTRNERVRRNRTRDARTRGRGGVDTTYTWQQIDITIEGTLAYRVYDLVTGDFVLEGSIEGDARERVERGTYPGNWQSLDLTGSEQALFDPEEWARQERVLAIQLSDQLAERLMRRVDDGLVRLID